MPKTRLKRFCDPDTVANDPLPRLMDVLSSAQVHQGIRASGMRIIKGNAKNGNSHNDSRNKRNKKNESDSGSSSDGNKMYSQ